MEILISLSFSLVGGLLLSRLAKKLNLPAVTAYLVAGLLLGPYCIGHLNLPGVGFATPEAVAPEKAHTAGKMLRLTMSIIVRASMPTTWQ